MRKQFIHGPDDASGIVFRLEHEIFRENDFAKNMANKKTTIHICMYMGEMLLEFGRSRAGMEKVGGEYFKSFQIIINKIDFFLKTKSTFIYAYR